MQRFVDPEFWLSLWNAGVAWLFEQVLVGSSLVQLATIGLLWVAAYYLSPSLRTWIGRINRWRGADYWLARTGAALSELALPFAWLALVWLGGIIATGLLWPHHLITIAVSLLAAWVVINLASSLFRDKAWSKFVALAAWVIAALNILGLLDATVTILDAADITFGDFRISALTVIKGIIALGILLWVANFLSTLLERRINRATTLTPSIQVLFSKLLKVVLVVIAIVVALSSVGIDLTAFTVFTGALGVGIGFGLQKTVSNLISGVMILMDKSIKPGDVIEVGNTYGWVNSLGGRYTSVVTRDGIEHLIPNEELIGQRVANWTHSNFEIRLKIPIGVSYDSNVHKAIELCIEAAGEVERVIDEPKTVCLLKGFGESSVDLEVRIWIRDPRNGVSNVKSRVMLGIWEKFHAHDIKFPFPQRDVHIVSGEAPTVVDD